MNIDKFLGTETVCYLLPAYGRRLSTPHQTLEDWKTGKDFRISGGPYTSIRDIDALKREFDRILLLTDKQYENIEV